MLPNSNCEIEFGNAFESKEFKKLSVFYIEYQIHVSTQLSEKSHEKSRLGKLFFAPLNVIENPLKCLEIS